MPSRFCDSGNERDYILCGIPFFVSLNLFIALYNAQAVLHHEKVPFHCQSRPVLRFNLFQNGNSRTVAEIEAVYGSSVGTLAPGTLYGYNMISDRVIRFFLHGVCQIVPACDIIKISFNMTETFLSFYLKANRIHVFVDALREIGCPVNICFMIGENGKTLILKPYPKKDFHSHRVPQDVYRGKKSMEVSSLRLCRIIADMQQWNVNYSYRVPGVIISRQRICVFYLDQAVPIKPS